MDIGHAIQQRPRFEVRSDLAALLVVQDLLHALDAIVQGIADRNPEAASRVQTAALWSRIDRLADEMMITNFRAHVAALPPIDEPRASGRPLLGPRLRPYNRDEILAGWATTPERTIRGLATHLGLARQTLSWQMTNAGLSIRILRARSA